MSTPINTLTLAQSRALLAAKRSEGVTLTSPARSRLEAHAASLEGVAQGKPKRAGVSALRKVAPPTESQEQAAFVAWFRANWRDLGCRSPLVLIASQAGAMLGGGNDRLRFARFAKLKREGFTRGVPDLFLAAPRAPYNGLWLELKRTKGGTVSQEQAEMHRILRIEGYCVVVARGAEEAKTFAESYLCCAKNS